MTDLTFPDGTNLLVALLGTNDLFQGCSLERVAQKLEQFLSGITLSQGKLLLIAPLMTLGEQVPNQQLMDVSKSFALCCRELAERMNIRFADARGWDIPLAYDGVHFTEAGHWAFVAGLLEVLI